MNNGVPRGELEMLAARTYGNRPYRTFLIHGGPGAAGELAPVARELSSRIGVVEPLQSKRTISELVLELRAIVEEHSDEPAYLVGYSWGAWLGYIFAALHPELVKKLVLVSSGPFDASYASGIKETRLSRFNEEDKKQVKILEAKLSQSGIDRNNILMQYGNLMSKADAFDHLVIEQNDEINVDLEIFQSVWKEASELRSSGELLKFGQRISCPVVVIHGDYDSHPAEGVVRPLEPIIGVFKYIKIENCGHMPWNERLAKHSFYDVLLEELK
jgi:pimeloyl-ACP methyl ester carboxylesterase